jgi:hypothetical protein
VCENELHNLYFSLNIIRVISQGEWDGQGKWNVWEKRCYYRVLAGKLEVKRTFSRPRLRCHTNVKIGLTDIEKDGVDWNASAYDKFRAVVNTVMNFVLRPPDIRSQPHVPRTWHATCNTRCIAATLTWHRKARGPPNWPLIVSQHKAAVEMRSTQSMYNMVLYKSVRITVLSDNIQQVTHGLRLIFSLWLIHLYTQMPRTSVWL